MTPDEIKAMQDDIANGTPGPWQVGSRHSENGVFSAENELVANTHGSQRNYNRGEQLRQQDANARRIARVPQLEAEVLRLRGIAAAAEGLAGLLDHEDMTAALRLWAAEVGDGGLAQGVSVALEAYRKSRSDQ